MSRDSQRRQGLCFRYAPTAATLGTFGPSDFARTSHSHTGSEIVDGSVGNSDLVPDVGIRGRELIRCQPTQTGTGLRTIRALCSPGNKVLGGGIWGLGNDADVLEHGHGPIFGEEPTYADCSGYRLHFHKFTTAHTTPIVYAICPYAE